MLKNIQNSMRKYWRSNLCIAGGALLVALSFIGCTKTDDRTGNDGFIPEGGDYKMYQDLIPRGFEIKTVRIDSISSDNFYYPGDASGTIPILYLGSQVTPREGQINYSFVTECYPESTGWIQDGSEPFGRGVQIDSAVIGFFINLEDPTIANVGKRYTVDIYELTKALPYPMDSTYYSNFDVTGYIGDKPIATVETKIGEHIYTKLPVEYVKKFMALQGEDYKSVSKFHENFKGFYVKSSSTQNSTMVNLVIPEESAIDIYYHNKNEKPDTAVFSIGFRKLTAPDYFNQRYFVNESFNMISRDYSLKDPVLGVNFENNIVSEITYVSGMAGLMTTLEISQAVIDDIKWKMKSKGGRKIIIANATLVVPCGDLTLDGLNGAIPSLGGYNQYQPISDVQSKYIAKDTPYMLQDYCGVYQTLSLFGGNLNRANGEYRMNISSTIQGLINGIHNNTKIEIAPGYAYKASTNVAVLENSTARPIKLELTYSVVE